jgi:hypothetical protein
MEKEGEERVQGEEGIEKLWKGARSAEAQEGTRERKKGPTARIHEMEEKKRLHRLTNNFNCRPRADVLPQELKEVKVLARRRVEFEQRLLERRNLEVARPDVPSLDEVVLSDNSAGLILIDERISCSVGRERTEVEGEARRGEGVGGEGEVEIERGRRVRERVEGRRRVDDGQDSFRCRDDSTSRATRRRLSWSIVESVVSFFCCSSCTSTWFDCCCCSGADAAIAAPPLRSCSSRPNLDSRAERRI